MKGVFAVAVCGVIALCWGGASAATPRDARPTRPSEPVAQVVPASPSPGPVTPGSTGGGHELPPIFGADVDVVAVDVSVVDSQGRPIQGLTPADFEIRVDDQPRTVLSAEFLSQDAAERAAAEPRPTHFTSNEGVVPGRLVLIAVDQGNIAMGGGRAVADAAGRLLDQLGPADRAALVAFPTPGPSVDFTSDFGQVREALRRVAGRARLSHPRFTLREALAYVDGDEQRWQEVLRRECPGGDPSTGDAAPGRTAGDANNFEACRGQLESDAGTLAQGFRRQSVVSLRSLQALFGALGAFDGPKSVVLISEGLVSESTADYEQLARTAGASQVTLYTLQLEPGADASTARAQDDSEDRLLHNSGLQALATLARGATFRVGGAGAGVFERIARELTGYYLLGIEPAAGDRDGRDHAIKVRVRHPGAAVRARRNVRFPSNEGEGPKMEDVLKAVIGAPFPATALPVRVATHALRDAASGKLRVLISAEIGHDAGTLGRVSVGYALVDSKGRMVASAVQRGQRPATPGGAAPFMGSLLVEPGLYTLKFAALDGRGRRGSVDHPVRALLASAEGIDLGDVMLTLPATRAGAAFEPAIDLEVAGQPVSTYVDLYAKDPGRLMKAQVQLEVAEREGEPALLSGPARLTLSDGGRANAQGSLSAGLLPPGDYVARAVLTVDGRRVAISERPFRVALGAGRAANVNGVAPAAGQPISLAGLAPSIGRFQREDALERELVAGFLARLETPAQERALVQALAQAREGRYDGLVATLEGSPHDSVALHFLRGLGLYASGQTAGAATQFQAALRLSSDFFPAAFYLGACAAASGQDLQAAGAWQTALVGEASHPLAYALAADALLRGNQPEPAAALLDEARVKWPQHAGLRRRAGIAYAMLGRETAALELLTGYLDANPQDTGALFVTMRLLFQSYLAGRTSDPLAGDRERLTRYAKTYVQAKGPQQELVAQWLKYLGKKGT